MIIPIITFLVGLVIGQIVSAVNYRLKMINDVDACRELLAQSLYRRAIRDLAKSLQNYGKK